MKGDAVAKRLHKPSPEGSEPKAVVAKLAAEPSDEELVRRVCEEGDRWAEEALFRRHVDAVLGTVTRLLRNRSDTEDVVQDTFITALGALHTLRDPSSVRSWLVTIAVRHVHRRFRRRRLRRSLGLDRGHPDDLRLDDLAGDSATQEQRSELRLLDEHLDRLPPAQRIAWMLRRVEGCSLKETAEACDCSLATVKRRIAAADARVREHVRIADAETGGAGGDDG